MKNVLEWLEHTAGEYPDKPAFIGEKTVTFAQVMNWAKAIGTYIARQDGLEPVAVFQSRTVTTPALYAGIVYGGRAYAPIDATLPEKRIGKILDNLKPSIILSDRSSEPRLWEIAQQLFGDARPNILVVDFERETICEATDEQTHLEEMALTKQHIDEQVLTAIRDQMSMTDPLYMIYTSGSSGNPKGVMTSHLSLITYINAYCKVMNIDADDCLGNQSPLDYIAAIRDIYIPYKTGCSTAIIPKEYFMEPNELFTYMNEKHVTAVGWSVSALTVPLKLGAFEEVELESLNKVCFSGSVMPCSALKVWQEHLPNALFVNQYGPTETTASCTYYVVDHKVTDEEVLPIGRAYDNYKVFLLDEAGHVANRGEICVAGPILALGYYNDPERTSKSFVNNPANEAYPERIYRTGDIGSLDEEGVLHFHGRMDRQVKHMGHRVELDEVEYAANAVEGITESACLYHKPKEVLYLYYAGDVDRRSLSLALRQSIPGFMVPRKLVQMELLPKLPNGKIDLKKLEGEMRS
ncbi:MAG: AMP-binding protein [Eubacterium sp.]|nr:AMP-binding protein [Eubacterium sp.]